MSSNKMKRWLWLTLVAVVILGAFRGLAEDKPPVVFDGLEDNQAVQGRVPVRLRGALEVVREVDLAFAYVQAPTVWFPLAQRRGLPADGLLAVWDTTALTDGDYLLRLRYTTQDGTSYTLQVKLRVRNYTPVETATPSPAPTLAPGSAGRPTATPTLTPTPTPLPPTPLPPNPAALDAAALPRIWLQGALGAALVLLGVAWYGFVRRQR